MSITDMSITDMSITDMSITDMSITDMSIIPTIRYTTLYTNDLIHEINLFMYRNIGIRYIAPIMILPLAVLINTLE